MGARKSEAMLKAEALERRVEALEKKRPRPTLNPSRFTLGRELSHAITLKYDDWCIISIGEDGMLHRHVALDDELGFIVGDSGLIAEGGTD